MVPAPGTVAGVTPGGAVGVTFIPDFTVGAGDTPGPGVGVAAGVGLAHPATVSAAMINAAIVRYATIFEYIVFDLSLCLFDNLPW
jgi:hypothetical protein